MIVMALIMFALRFLDPSSFIAISVQFLSIVDVTRAAGLPPLVLMAPIIIACVPFWMTYQNFWVAMGEGLTSIKRSPQPARAPGQRIRAVRSDRAHGGGRLLEADRCFNVTRRRSSLRPCSAIENLSQARSPSGGTTATAARFSAIHGSRWSRFRRRFPR